MPAVAVLMICSSEEPTTTKRKKPGKAPSRVCLRRTPYNRHVLLPPRTRTAACRKSAAPAAPQRLPRRRAADTPCGAGAAQPSRRGTTRREGCRTEHHRPDAERVLVARRRALRHVTAAVDVLVVLVSLHAWRAASGGSAQRAVTSKPQWARMRFAARKRGSLCRAGRNRPLAAQAQSPSVWAAPHRDCRRADWRARRACRAQGKDGPRPSRLCRSGDAAQGARSARNARVKRGETVIVTKRAAARGALRRNEASGPRGSRCADEKSVVREERRRRRAPLPALSSASANLVWAHLHPRFGGPPTSAALLTLHKRGTPASCCASLPARCAAQPPRHGRPP